MPHKPPAASPAATSEAILVRQPVRDDGTFGGAQSELSLVEGGSHWRHSQERRFVLTRLAIDRCPPVAPLDKEPGDTCDDCTAGCGGVQPPEGCVVRLITVLTPISKTRARCGA